ncbi:MAG: efflux RND transporter periplasmic adaptor subunit [Victivallaceae bacterium]
MMTGMKIKLIVKILVLLIIIGGVFYWFRLAPVNVQAYKIVKGTVVNEVMGTGTLEARIRANISPKISGLLVEVLTDQNARIVKGQLLARLDDGDWRQQVEVAKSDLDAAKATVERIGAEIESAQATAVRARANLERNSSLRKNQVVAQKELESAVESNDVAEANIRRAQLARIEAQRTVEKSEASLHFYQERLKDTSLCAPFDGLVVRRNRDPGAVVVPGTSILDVISTDELWISAWVDETAMGLLASGQSARIVFRSASDTMLGGKVARLGSETDRETREFIVDVDVLQLPKKWAVGQRAEVYIETGRRNDILFVPQKFVIWRDGQPGVFIDDAGKAKWQKISMGLRGKENVEVTEGLSSDKIVISALPGTDLPGAGRAIRYDKP